MNLKPIYNFEMAHRYPLSVAIIYGLLRQSVEYGTESTRISFNDIANITGLSRRSVIEGLKRLEKEGLIKKQKVEYDKNIYSIVDISKYPSGE